MCDICVEHVWGCYIKFDRFMLENENRRCHVDHFCYYKTFDNGYTILLFYVDDMLAAGSNIHEIKKIKKIIIKEIKDEDLGANK